MANKVRLFTQSLGIVKSFKGYADLLGLPTAFRLRSELQSSGISLIDCPSADRTSVASKTMLVDLLTHTVDNMPSMALVIIAGNSDFSYAISILRLRRYQVILICPKDRVGSHSQASLYLDWFHDFLGDEYKVGDAQIPPDQRRPRSHIDSTPSGASHATFATALSHVDTHPHETQVQLPADTTRPSIITSPSGASSRRGCADPRPMLDLGEQEPIRATWYPPTETSRSQERESNQLAKSPASMESEVQTGYIQRPSSAPPSYSSFSPAPSPLPCGFCPPTPPHSCDPISMGPSLISRTGPCQNDDYENMNIEVEEPEQLVLLPQSPASTETVMPSLSRVLPSPHVDMSSSRTVAPPSRAMPLEASRVVPAITIPSPIPALELGQTSTSSVPTPRFSPLVMSRSALPSMSSISPKVAPALTVLATPRLASTPMAAPIPQPQPAAPSVIPDHFRYLVKVLRDHQAKGEYKPFRPGVAALVISTNSSDMRAVGAINFTQYAQLAEEAGIVELPGKPGELWIGLRSELSNAKA